MLRKVTCFKVNMNKCPFNILHLFNSVLQAFAYIVSTPELHFLRKHYIDLNEEFWPERVCSYSVDANYFGVVIPREVSKLCQKFWGC